MQRTDDKTGGDMAAAGAAAPVPDESPCNNLALRQASRHLSQVYDRHLAGTGLSGSQYSILSRLARLGALTIGRLAEALVLDRTALGRALKPLQRDKLVVIAAGDDARVRQVSLTARGRTKFEAARQHWLKAQTEFEAAYGGKEAAALRAALRRVIGV